MSEYNIVALAGYVPVCIAFTRLIYFIITEFPICAKTKNKHIC